jgi:hypothetical protein
MQNPPKLSPKWYGPFRVLHKVGQVSYQIQLPANCKLHDVFHVSHLKKHKGEHAVPKPILPMVTNDGKVKTVPIAILQRRIIPRSTSDLPMTQWLIHWDTMTSAEATWEDAEFIQKAYPDFQP